MITRINEFHAAEGKAEDLLTLLTSLIAYIQSSEGCFSCEVLRHHEHREQFVVLEKWESIAAHKHSIENFPKNQMQKAIGLFKAPPKGEYYEG
jgi:quinol monooxygenase YgiN